MRGLSCIHISIDSKNKDYPVDIINKLNIQLNSVTNSQFLSINSKINDCSRIN